MCYLGFIKFISYFSFFVLTNFIKSYFINIFIFSIWNEGSYFIYCMSIMLMVYLDKAFSIVSYEWYYY